MRVVFFGSPDFAVPSLRRLAAMAEIDLALVVTQPDRPSGRGRRLDRSAVAKAAEDLGLPVHQPATLRDPASRRPLAALDADLFVVAAYGIIFGPKTLALPRLGCVNVHASLLPRYRGASPIAAAILAGDRRTGVSLMRMDPGLDTGPTIAIATTEIAPTATTATLTARLSDLGADLLARSLPPFVAGDLPPTPQPSGCASLTRPLTKADGWVDWDRPAVEVARHVRAMWPWPRAWTTANGDALQIHGAAVAEPAAVGPPGTILRSHPDLLVATADGAVRLDNVQPAGSRPMPGSSFAAGRRLEVGARLGIDGGPSNQPPIVVPG